MIKNVWSILFPPNLHLLHLLYHLEASPGRYFSSFVVVQLLTCVWLFAIPWTAARQASLSFTVSQSLLKLIFIESVMPSNHLILCHPLLLLHSIFLIIRVFFNESALRIRWPNYGSFSFSIVLPMYIQGWFPLGLTGLISLLSNSHVFSHIKKY